MGKNSLTGTVVTEKGDDGFKLIEGRFPLDIRMILFTMNKAGHWNRLPREAENAPSLEAFKSRLDGALGNLV